MKKIMKLAVAVLVAVALIATLSLNVFATDVDLNSFDNVGNTGGADNAVTNIIGAVLQIAQVVGAGVAVIMLIVLAIRYIAASPEGKGEIKKNATQYIVGAIILFAASAILGIIQNFALNVG